MIDLRPLPRLAAGLSVLLVAAGCDKKQDTAVVDAAAPTVAEAPVEAGPVDIAQCAGCQLVAQQSWTFAGIYRDERCTDPVAQVVLPACAPVPALGPTTLTYVDEVGSRKAGETANVTLVEQLAPETARYRKTAKGCVPANEAAVDVTPMNCVGERVCRDSAGTLTCSNCRTFTNGCPDFEETRYYASIDDPAAGTKKVAGGGNSALARLKQCCAALAAEAKRLGASPEAGVLASAAAQCNTIAASGNAPEVGVLKNLLAGRTIPPVCAGF